MEKLLSRYLKECSEICNTKGYTGLEGEFQNIKKRLSNGECSELILERYVQVTRRYCEQLSKRGVRIFSWSSIDKRVLISRLLEINNSSLKS